MPARFNLVGHSFQVIPASTVSGSANTFLNYLFIFNLFLGLLRYSSGDANIFRTAMTNYGSAKFYDVRHYGCCVEQLHIRVAVNVQCLVT